MDNLIIYIVCSIILIFLIYIFIYNKFISIRQYVFSSWSGIDVQLKRRTELIPNLVNTVKGYAVHEKKLLEEITNIRSKLVKSDDDDVLENSKLNHELTKELKNLFMVAENYPDLKANKNFLKLQTELTKTENQIAAQRRIYNSNVMIYNTKVESFPSFIIAKIHNFKKFNFFKK
ncbi:MAG: LemA family protein, partial [Nanoarchaeota archaeon]